MGPKHHKTPSLQQYNIPSTFDKGGFFSARMGAPGFGIGKRFLELKKHSKLVDGCLTEFHKLVVSLWTYNS